ncbi:hypothetical protein [Pseudobutyrivibrio xylanivorans]|uniref:Uncharacterized protein n=1 Tax=Pseudobutyrivibrio xylanivorans TaxID=185007 RepID=A0A5P6VMH8_PSEXY|nr:hypothetical protein [Pseudobutyrivibrio xylanivorans]QFJ53568.1 hypothetical protein FXF36_01140 [Pseudobutyrivibrio xylanivorans]
MFQISADPDAFSVFHRKNDAMWSSVFFPVSDIGRHLTEEDLYNEYGKVITSTGDKFCEEMNKRFPEYTTSIHKYMSNTELIDAAYENLARGVSVFVTILQYRKNSKGGLVWKIFL